MEMICDDSTMRLFINGVQYGTPITISNSFTEKTGTMYFGRHNSSDSGQDCYIGRVFVGKANTPQIWTAFGRPLFTQETLKNDTTIKQYGGTDNYQVSWGPDGNQIITLEDELE
jgi:hypothetical protein